MKSACVWLSKPFALLAMMLNAAPLNLVSQPVVLVECSNRSKLIDELGQRPRCLPGFKFLKTLDNRQVASFGRLDVEG